VLSHAQIGHLVWAVGVLKGAKIRGLGKLECIVGERNDFVFDAFLNLEPVERLDDR
jgi:hypothetical protein